MACGLVQTDSSIHIDTFDFRHSRADPFSANHHRFPVLTCAARFGTAFALEREATLRINCEVVMWKITTRDFTLEEVFFMAARNLLAGADIAQHKKRGSQQSKGDRTWS
jgi:hypothetical protein